METRISGFVEQHRESISRFGYDNLGFTGGFEKRVQKLFRHYNVTKQTSQHLWRKGWLDADEAFVRHKQKSGNWGQQRKTKKKRAVARTRVKDTPCRLYSVEFSRFRLIALYYLVAHMNHMSSIENFTSKKALKGYVEFHNKYIVRRFSHDNMSSFTVRINELVEILQICCALVGERVQSAIPEPVRWEENPLDCPEKFDAKVVALWLATQELFTELGLSWFEKWHESLRIEAAKLMDYDELFYLLRYSVWDSRENLEGDLGVSMILREGAELIRRAVWVIFRQDLPDEDMCFSQWAPDGRKHVYGNQSPFDDSLLAVNRVMEHFQLRSASKCYLYVEGMTEFGFFESAIRHYKLEHIVLVDINGSIKEATVKELVRVNKLSRQYSFFVIDGDSDKMAKLMRDLASELALVGSVFINDPDFELGFCEFGAVALAICEILKERRIDVSLNELEFLKQGEGLCPDWHVQVKRKFRTSDIKGKLFGSKLFQIEILSGLSKPAAEIIRQCAHTLSASFDHSANNVPVYEISVGRSDSIMESKDGVLSKLNNWS